MILGNGRSVVTPERAYRELAGDLREQTEAILREKSEDGGHGCRLWTGPASGSSPDRLTGRFYYRGNRLRVHRLAAELWLENFGVGDRLEVHQTCLNPLCIAPEHLELREKGFGLSAHRKVQKKVRRQAQREAERQARRLDDTPELSEPAHPDLPGLLGNGRSSVSVGTAYRELTGALRAYSKATLSSNTVDGEYGCQVWTGSSCVDGVDNPRTFGYLYYRGNNVPIHRLAAMLCMDGFGPDDRRLVYRHCSNTLCIAPDHLALRGEKVVLTPELLERGQRDTAKRNAAKRAENEPPPDQVDIEQLIESLFGPLPAAQS